MPDKAAAGVYYVHQIQTRCGALTMRTTTAPVSTSRRAPTTPTAATHGHHFSTQVAVQHRLQHVNDRITQDAQLVLTAVHEDAGVDGDVDGEDDDDDDVVVVTSKMTVQRARPALHTAATGVTSAVDALPPAGQGCPRYKPGKQTIDGVQGLQAASMQTRKYVVHPANVDRRGKI